MGEPTKVVLDGSRVIVEADSEAAAKELAADAKAAVLKREGTWIAWFEARADDVSRWLAVGGQGVFWWLAWVAFAFAAYMAYTSLERVYPGTLAGALFGCVGVGLAFGMKIAGGKAAKNFAEKDWAATGFYGVATVICAAVIIIFSALYQGAIEDDRQSGVFQANRNVSQLEDKITELRTERRKMLMAPGFPSKTVDKLSEELILLVSERALNSQGVDTERPVGEFIGLGEGGVLDENGELVDLGSQFCTGDSYYVLIYCEPILKVVEDLDVRLTYEDKGAEIDALNAQIAATQDSVQRQSSVMIFAGGVEDGEQAGAAVLFSGAGAQFLVDLIMLLFVFLDKWAKYRQPKVKESVA